MSSMIPSGANTPSAVPTVSSSPSLDGLEQVRNVASYSSNFVWVEDLSSGECFTAHFVFPYSI